MSLIIILLCIELMILNTLIYFLIFILIQSLANTNSNEIVV